MTRTSRKLLAGVWGATGCVLALLAALLFLEPPVQRRVLQNGTPLELLETTYGREHYHLEGNLWQRAWQTVNRLRQPPPRSDFAPNFRRTPVEAPVLWFHWQDPKHPDLATEVNRWSAFAIDEHGCCFPCDTNLGLAPPPIPDLLLYDSALPPEWDRKVSAVPLDCYPRRTGRFRYAVVLRSDLQRAVSFDVAVPPGGPFPEWKGQPCPVIARDGNVTFELTRISFPQGKPGKAEATFRYRENGRPTANWCPDLVTVTDATGNSLEQYRTRSPDDPVVDLPTLCRREAWKVRVRFVRADPARAKPDFTWKVQGSPTSPGTSLQIVQWEAGWGAVELGIPWVIANDGNTTPVRMVVVPVRGSDSRYTLALLKASDRPGRTLRLIQPGRLLTLQPDQRDYQFDIPWNSAEPPVDLTFGLYRTHTVEFLVQPSPLQP